ncbi:MAG: cyclic pyranopterin monophosphate synthase MoaC [Endomicrobiia bacterium]|nr:cyclic pyranopterin monophosphate synthase MoaC [Endomicrobiia bacterium]
MRFTHLDALGKIRMVDIGGKKASRRMARAEAFVKLSAGALAALKKNALTKGDALACAKIAAISAAKKTSEIIPLSHQINLSHIAARFDFESHGVRITSSAETRYATGVEMEALVAAAAAALTLYDMLKGIERGIEISGLRLLEKTGGKSDWRAKPRRRSG